MHRPVALGACLILVIAGSGAAIGASPVASPVVLVPPSASAGSGLPAPDLDAIFAPTEPPIDLAVSHAEADQVEADIPLEGGIVEATGADGTRYTLTIPPDALLEATRIGIAPLTSVEGLPVGGEVTYGVQLAPDGLALMKPAILRIEPAVALAPDDQVPFGYDHDGSGMFIAEPVVDSAAIDIVVRHFSGYGITRGLLADTEPVRQRLGGDAERRLSSQVAQTLGAERQRQLDNGEHVDAADVAEIYREAFTRFEVEVLAPRLAAAGASCANARVALETLLTYEGQRQQLGMEESSFGGNERLPALVDTGAEVCVKEEYEVCRDQHVVHRIIGVVRGFERQRQLIGSENQAALDAQWAYAKRCLTFRLDFESNVTVKSQGVALEPSMRAKVKLTFDPDANRISGSDTQEMFKFKVKVPKCSATEHPADATLEVASLTWTVVPTIWRPERGRIEDYALAYKPGFPRESITLKCPKIPPLEAPLSLWYPSYVMTHQDQWETSPSAIRAQALAQGLGGGPLIEITVPKEFSGELRLTGWEVQEAPLLARQTWSSKALGGKVEDVGSFELYHTPG